MASHCVASSNCLVAEHHWHMVDWAIVEYAWRFEPLIEEVKL